MTSHTPIPPKAIPTQTMPQVIDDTDDEIDLLALAGALWRGKWWIALFAAVAVLIGGYYAYKVAIPEYTARATVALENRQEKVVDFQNVLSGLAGDQASINTEVEVLKSRALAEKLVRRLNLTEDPEFNVRLRPEPDFDPKAYLRDLVLGPAPEAPAPTDRQIMDATIDSVLKAINVSNKRQSYVFDITAVTTSAEKSALMANTLADIYITDQLDAKFEATQKAVEWLNARASELKSELERMESRLKEFESGTTLVSPEALAALNVQLKQQRERVEEAAATAKAKAAEVAALEEALQTGDLERMAEIAQDRTLKRVLDLVRSGSASEDDFRARFQQIVDRARLEQQRAESQEAALRTAVAELESQIEQQSADLVTMQQMQREVEASRTLYEYFLGRLKEATVQQGIQQPDSRVLSPAVVPTAPSAPRRTLVLALSLLLGLMGGAGFVLVREMLHNTFVTADDVERRTGVVVMGQIPLVPARGRRKIIDYFAEKPTSAAAEAVRNLRTSVLLSNVDNPPQVILFTSSQPGEGKTTDSISLALNLAGLGKKVLLVEGDIRRRTFGQYFDTSNRKGLLSVLSGEAKLEDVVLHEDKLGFDILLGEKSNTNAADVFSSEKFHRFVADLRKIYDYILIDTPPVLVVPDARVIASSADAILYAIKWDSTPKSQVEQGLRMFETVNLRVTGMVLSQIDPKKLKHYGYGGKYGGYYGYGATGYYDN